MAGIKRKEAPKAVAAVRSSEKKQKLASTGSIKKKAAPIKEPTPESDESSEDEDEDELDGEDDAMSGVELEGGNSESDDKKIRSTSRTGASRQRLG
ncbi:unnamed protein product [Aureobasidium vineae]|uniref:Uncharacterized protein n=1 Tax=Aureobasidium vineae TaxID=2773715 RepID=A0A9N8P5S2_9PEZI|nr:unnamed protein product [Aureobasidium vineae]